MKTFGTWKTTLVTETIVPYEIRKQSALDRILYLTQICVRENTVFDKTILLRALFEFPV